MVAGKCSRCDKPILRKEVYSWSKCARCELLDSKAGHQTAIAVIDAKIRRMDENAAFRRLRARQRAQ
jgi:hypothetical protein